MVLMIYHFYCLSAKRGYLRIEGYLYYRTKSSSAIYKAASLPFLRVAPLDFLHPQHASLLWTLSSSSAPFASALHVSSFP